MFCGNGGIFRLPENTRAEITIKAKTVKPNRMGNSNFIQTKHACQKLNDKYQFKKSMIYTPFTMSASTLAKPKLAASFIAADTKLLTAKG